MERIITLSFRELLDLNDAIDTKLGQLEKFKDYWSELLKYEPGRLKEEMETIQAQTLRFQNLKDIIIEEIRK